MDVSCQEIDQKYVIKYIFYIGMVNLSGKRRSYIQIVILLLSLLVCGVLVYPCGYAYPNLFYEDILVHASLSVFVINTCLVIEAFAFPMRRQHHMEWKMARELFNAVYSLTIGIIFLTGFAYTCYYIFGDIPYTVMGETFGYIFLSAIMLSAVVAILCIAYGIISVLAYHHYKFVNKMSEKAILEWKRATKPPTNKLL